MTRLADVQHRLTRNLELVIVGFIFFPAVIVISVLFLVSLLIAALCVTTIAMVKFSFDVINKRNGIVQTTEQTLPWKR